MLGIDPVSLPINQCLAWLRGEQYRGTLRKMPGTTTRVSISTIDVFYCFYFFNIFKHTIFETLIIVSLFVQQYVHRPEVLENCCLHRFVAQYDEISLKSAKKHGIPIAQYKEGYVLIASHAIARRECEKRSAGIDF